MANTKLKQVLGHLKGDAKKWHVLHEQAEHEESEDRKLIKKLMKR